MRELAFGLFLILLYILIKPNFPKAGKGQARSDEAGLGEPSARNGAAAHEQEKTQ